MTGRFSAPWSACRHGSCSSCRASSPGQSLSSMSSLGSRDVQLMSTSGFLTFCDESGVGSLTYGSGSGSGSWSFRQGIVSWPFFVFHVILRFQRCSALCPHCKEPMPKTNIPRKRIAWPQSQFPHSCVCERFIYSHHRSACSFAGKYCMWTDPGKILISHRHMNVDIGTEAAHFPEKEYINGIFVAVHLCSEFLTFWDESRSGLGSLDPYTYWIMAPDLDPALFVSGFQDAKKKFAY